MKNKKLIAILAIVALLIGGLWLYHDYNAHIGVTEESREQLLHGSIVPETNWSIATETEIEGYLVSAIYASNNKSGLAIFEPIKNGGYKFQYGIATDAGQPIVEHNMINRNHYDLIWFNGAQTEYAEVIYTIDGQQQEAIRFDTADMGIIYNHSPAKEYSIQVIYYDADGNTYETPMLID